MEHYNSHQLVRPSLNQQVRTLSQEINQEEKFSGEGHHCTNINSLTCSKHRRKKTPVNCITAAFLPRTLIKSNNICIVLRSLPATVHGSGVSLT